MNHVYRIIWSDASTSFIAVAETAGSRGKRSLGKRLRTVRALALAASLLAAANVLADPSGGQVSAGSGRIEQSGAITTITQATQKMAINWQGFNIAAGETVNFLQPNSSAVALNRVLGTNGTQILGQLKANGQVYLLNPNGVLFGAGAQVSVGSIIASSLQMNDADFMAGKMTFSGQGGAVTNDGNLTANAGGYVALLGGQVVNHGTIMAKMGTVALGAGQQITLDFSGDGLLKMAVDKGLANALTDNRGLLQADGGTVIMAAQTADALRASVVNNEGVIQARSLENHGGVIRLSGTQVSNAGSLDASGAGGAGGVNGGRIAVNAGYAMLNSGSLNASGANGGSISVTTHNLIEAGQYEASGAAQGGSISLIADHHIEQTVASTLKATGGTAQGGAIRIEAAGDAWLSGRASANGRTGGEIAVTAPELVMAGANLAATGADGGGRIRVGGGWQGSDPDLANAARTRLVDTQFDVSATARGNGGTAVVWSDNATLFGGDIKAKGGALGGDGGKVEVSSHGQLGFGGTVDAAAPFGRSGQLLLDPKDIVIVAEVAGTSVLPIENTAPAANAQFGSGAIVELKNGNASINRLVIASPFDDVNAVDAGAVRLYDSQTGALQSVITGRNANDNIGSGGLTPLVNGNFVVASPKYSDLGNGPIGAVTWIDGLVPYAAGVSSANSLAGSSAGDRVGSDGVTALNNGHYVVASPHWNYGLTAEAGAVIWANGSIRTSGLVDSSNSLHGVSTGDQIGSGGITRLSNGNYVVASPNWANGPAASKVGAVTLMNGASGGIGGGLASPVAGVVIAGPGSGGFNPGNSATGTITNDQVGSGGVTALANGNFVVSSPSWNNNIANSKVGAVTLVGAFGMNVPIGTTNSLYGTLPNDQLGSGGITVLNNQNYVIVSPVMDVPNGGSLIVDGGAVTWASGSSIFSGGQVVPSNSLVGGNTKDMVGSGGVLPLNNGNYLVLSPLWNNGGAANPDLATGAVTFAKGGAADSRPVGFLGSSNSLTGTTFSDKVGNGGVTILNNDNYVVSSNAWNRPAAGQALSAAKVGAVTWGSGTNGVAGIVSASNSQVGKIAGDMLGSGGITALASGNYVVASPLWHSVAATGSPVANVGAVTFNPGNVSTTGELTAQASLVGNVAGDMVGNGGVTALSNGNYVVASPNFSADINGTTYASAGAVTWGNGTDGTSGTLTSSNSLVGSHVNDRVGNLGVTALTNGNYVVASGAWGNAQQIGGSAASFGAATFGKGAIADGGVTGMVSATNSLTGNANASAVSFLSSGVSGVVALQNGDYLVRSPFWNKGAIGGVGAVTWGSGTVGVRGIVSATNSLTGSTLNDAVGSGTVVTLADGRAVVASPLWDAAGAANAGRVDILGEQSAYTFATNPVGTSTIVTSDLQRLLGQNGTVTLQANNDITLAANSALAITNTGNLLLQAGRSIVLNSGITTNGGVTLIANESTANGVIRGSRVAGSAVITMANGTSINAGGNVDIAIHDGAGLNDPTSGSISLANITANQITVVNGGVFPDAGGARIVVGGNLHASAGSGDGIVLAGGVFRNDQGPTALTTNGSRWLVWSIDPALDNRNGLNYDFKQYGATYGSNVSIAGNGVLYALTPQFAVALVGGSSRTYDGTTAMTLTQSSYALAGPAIDGDVITLNYPASGTVPDANVGNNKMLTVTGIAFAAASDTGKPVVGYQLQNTTVQAAIGNITPRVINLAASRIYDGSTNIDAASAMITMANLVGGETLGISGSSMSATKDVGNALLPDTRSLALADGSHGGLAGNYTLAGGTHASSITPYVVSLNGSRAYDGSTAIAAGVLQASLAAGKLVNNESLSVSGDGSVAGKDVGTAMPLALGSLALADGANGGVAANYTLSGGAHAASITPYVVSLTGSRAYDSSTVVNAGIFSIGALVAGESVVLSGSGSVPNPNAGPPQPVSIGSLMLNDGTGGMASNYTLGGGANAATITQAGLALSTSAVHKTYDGTVSANGAPVVVGGALTGGDTLIGGSFAYLDKHAGTGKSVAVSGITVNDGNGGGNYSISYVDNTASSITPAALVLSTMPVTKVYDGTVVAAGTPVVKEGTLYGADTASGGTYAYADPNIGTGKTVTASDITLNDGNGGANYSISYVPDLASVILASTRMADPRQEAGAVVAEVLAEPGRLGADRPFPQWNSTRATWCVLASAKCAAFADMSMSIKGSGILLPEGVKPK